MLSTIGDDYAASAWSCHTPHLCGRRCSVGDVIQHVWGRERCRTPTPQMAAGSRPRSRGSAPWRERKRAFPARDRSQRSGCSTTAVDPGTTRCRSQHPELDSSTQGAAQRARVPMTSDRIAAADVPRGADAPEGCHQWRTAWAGSTTPSHLGPPHGPDRRCC